MTDETGEGGAPPLREYANDRITVEWRAERCIHSANCVRALPRVFNPKRRPWVEVDAASADEVEAAVLRCPSGALQYRRHDQPTPAPDAPAPPPTGMM